jgi:spore coat-associated protein N
VSREPPSAPVARSGAVAAAGARPPGRSPSRPDRRSGKRARLVLVLMLLLVAVAVAMGSAAALTSSFSNPRSAFTAGTLTMTNTRENASVLTANKMVPGGAATGAVTIKNSGTVPGSFRLSASQPTDTPGTSGGKVSTALLLTIVDRAQPGSPVYNGRYDSMPERPLGTWAAAEQHTYDFTVTFPESNTSGDNAYQESSTSITFTWKATSG